MEKCPTYDHDTGESLCPECGTPMTTEGCDKDMAMYTAGRCPKCGHECCGRCIRKDTPKKQPACPFCGSTSYDIYEAFVTRKTIELDESDNIVACETFEEDEDGFYFDCCYAQATLKQAIAYLKSVRKR